MNIKKLKTKTVIELSDSELEKFKTMLHLASKGFEYFRFGNGLPGQYEDRKAAEGLRLEIVEAIKNS